MNVESRNKKACIDTLCIITCHRTKHTSLKVGLGSKYTFSTYVECGLCAILIYTHYNLYDMITDEEGLPDTYLAYQNHIRIC